MKRPGTSRKSRKYIGKHVPRLADGLKKARGEAEFLDDFCQPLRFPGMLYAKVLTSPYPHARIKKMDTSKAEALPGVKAVLTCFDPEIRALKPTSHAWASVGSTVPYNRWANLRYNDQHVLGDTFHCYGDKNGAVVAAETEQLADKALKLIDIEWEVLPFYLDSRSALQPGACAIHPEINPQGNLLPADPRRPDEDIDVDEEVSTKDVFYEKNDVEKGFSESDVIVEWTSRHHYADHACLDTMGCMIYWEDDRLVCHTNSYQADQTRMMIAEMLELPLHRVRVICPYLGASMGRWNTGDQSFFIFTALLAKQTRRPVKYKHTRREDFHDTRLQITWTGKLGAKQDGTIRAASFYGLSDVGAHANQASGILKYVPFEICERQLAHIPHVRMEGYMVYTNRIPSGMMRSTGNIQFNQMFGPLVDQLAERFGMDPIELVLKNFGQEWLPQPNASLEAVLREGKEHIGWGNRHPAGKGPLFEGCKKRGLGFSFHQCWHAEWEEKPRGEIQVGVTINPDLSVLLMAPTVETGSGSNNVALLACAESLDFLGVTPQDIRWIEKVDTDTSLKDAVQTDSAVGLLMAELMVDVAAKVKEKVLDLASIHFKLSAKLLDVDDGRVFAEADPRNYLSVRDLLWRHADYVPYVPITVFVSRGANPELTGVPYQATFVEVEVDIETGEVKVLRMAVVNDTGTVLNATGAEAQQIGGQTIGLGETLCEEIVYDRRTGIPLNFNFIDYKVPAMEDIPLIEPVLLEVWKGAGEYGASGLAEGTLVNTPAAVLNAVHNAIGIRMDRIPVRPADILEALREKSIDETF
ncbi:MAG: molybdopterin-dependent oxidoreductase [Candidatus Aminicenantes bacterium]|nr:molybdopterin-dependent oxidoreductase [Candidatus Aminicenantes bacterium]